jgi:prevent-host-death family protein
MKATAKDLRFYSERLLAKVSQGEEVIITHRGKPCAKLVPLDGAVSKTMTDDGLFGIWKDNKAAADVQGHIAKLRKGRSL